MGGNIDTALELITRQADARVEDDWNHTALTHYGLGAYPLLSASEKQQGQARLIAAWLAGPHPSQVAERNWQRRKKAVMFLVGSKFRPMQRDAAAAKLAQEQVDKHAKLPGIPRRSKEENWPTCTRRCLATRASSAASSACCDSAFFLCVLIFVSKTMCTEFRQRRQQQHLFSSPYDDPDPPPPLDRRPTRSSRLLARSACTMISHSTRKRFHMALRATSASSTMSTRCEAWMAAREGTRFAAHAKRITRLIAQAKTYAATGNMIRCRP